MASERAVSEGSLDGQLLKHTDAKLASPLHTNSVLLKRVQFRNAYKFSLNEVNYSKLLYCNSNTGSVIVLRSNISNQVYSELNSFSVRYVVISAIQSYSVLKWKMNRYQIFSIHYFSVRYVIIFAILFCPLLNWWRWTDIWFSVIIKCSLNLVDSVFNILKFHHTNDINSKWKPEYYCLLYMIYNSLM
jgi:hypothetical protein